MNKTREHQFMEEGMKFLMEFHFDRLRWNGEEVIVWTRLNFSFRKDKFQKGSKIRKALENLEYLVGALDSMSVLV